MREREPGERILTTEELKLLAGAYRGTIFPIAKDENKFAVYLNNAAELQNVSAAKTLCDYYLNNPAIKISERSDIHLNRVLTSLKCLIESATEGDNKSLIYLKSGVTSQHIAIFLANENDKEFDMIEQQQTLKARISELPEPYLGKDMVDESKSNFVYKDPADELELLGLLYLGLEYPPVDRNEALAAEYQNEVNNASQENILASHSRLFSRLPETHQAQNIGEFEPVAPRIDEDDMEPGAPKI